MEKESLRQDIAEGAEGDKTLRNLLFHRYAAEDGAEESSVRQIKIWKNAFGRRFGIRIHGDVLGPKFLC
jgi:hypothetical protein